MADRKLSPEIRALILYAYGLGGNTREIARLTGIPHDDVTDALFQAAHDHAMSQIDVPLPDEGMIRADREHCRTAHVRHPHDPDGWWCCKAATCFHEGVIRGDG